MTPQTIDWKRWLGVEEGLAPVQEKSCVPFACLSMSGNVDSSYEEAFRR
jgi:hypothetical protein